MRIPLSTSTIVTLIIEFVLGRYKEKGEETLEVVAKLPSRLAEMLTLSCLRTSKAMRKPGWRSR